MCTTIYFHLTNPRNTCLRSKTQLRTPALKSCGSTCVIRCSTGDSKIPAFYDCLGMWTGTCRPRRTHRQIDMYPRATQAIRICVATSAFTIITGYRRLPVTRTRRTSVSAGSRTLRPGGLAAVPVPVAPAARHPISGRLLPRRRC